MGTHLEKCRLDIAYVQRDGVRLWHFSDIALAAAEMSAIGGEADMKRRCDKVHF